jgi:hypothetical protein
LRPVSPPCRHRPHTAPRASHTHRRGPPAPPALLGPAPPPRGPRRAGPWPPWRRLGPPRAAASTQAEPARLQASRAPRPCVGAGLRAPRARAASTGCRCEGARCEGWWGRLLTAACGVVVDPWTEGAPGEGGRHRCACQVWANMPGRTTRHVSFMQTQVSRTLSFVTRGAVGGGENGRGPVQICMCRRPGEQPTPPTTHLWGPGWPPPHRPARPPPRHRRRQGGGAAARRGRTARAGSGPRWGVGRGVPRQPRSPVGEARPSLQRGALKAASPHIAAGRSSSIAMWPPSARCAHGPRAPALGLRQGSHEAWACACC